MRRRGVAYAAIGIAGFMLLGILLNAGRGFSYLAILGALAFCVILPAAVGLSLLRAPDERKPSERANQAWDAELIRLAERRGGSLTVAETMAHVDLSHSEAERHLERLCVHGVAEHRVSEEGVIVYRFQPLLSEQQKRRAVGLLDD
jgi:hypothetical protein